VSLSEEIGSVASSECYVNSILCFNGLLCLSYTISVTGAQKAVVFLQTPREIRHHNSVDKRSASQIRRLLTESYPLTSSSFASSRESHGVIMRNELEKRCALSVQEDALLNDINSLDLHLWQMATVVDALQSNLSGINISIFRYM
jgi:hypothetical protein